MCSGLYPPAPILTTHSARPSLYGLKKASLSHALVHVGHGVFSSSCSQAQWLDAIIQGALKETTWKPHARRLKCTWPKAHDSSAAETRPGLGPSPPKQPQETKGVSPQNSTNHVYSTFSLNVHQVSGCAASLPKRSRRQTSTLTFWTGRGMRMGNLNIGVRTFL